MDIEQASQDRKYNISIESGIYFSRRNQWEEFGQLSFDIK